MRLENITAAAGGSKVRIARNGTFLGEFTVEEVILIIQRQDGTFLMTDHIFDTRKNEWRRISEVLSEAVSATSILCGFGVIIVAALLILRYHMGSWSSVFSLLTGNL